MREIIHEDAIERLQEQFNADQLREISFALNPDSENLDWTIYHIEENKLELDSEIDDLKERVTDLCLLVADHGLLDNDEFIESLLVHTKELKLVVEEFINE